MPASASRSNSPIPQYRLHKARGLGVVALNGKDHYLGPYDTPQSREAYNRLVADWLSNGRQMPLEQLAIIVQDGRLMVRLADGELAEPDGQLQIEFEPDPAPLKMPLARSATPASPKTAAQWFDQGVEQEANGYLAEAADSCRKALKAGGPDARACFNLANALSALGLHREAVERYEQAVEVEPDFVDAWNNLGIALAELDRHEEAILAFREVLARDPEHAMANYNVADQLDEIGCGHDARTHWEAYLRRDPFSDWARHARSRLAPI